MSSRGVRQGLRRVAGPGSRGPWGRLLAVLASIVLATPLLAGLAAAPAAITRFGWHTTLVDGGPIVLWAAVPVVTWLAYLRRPPRTVRSRIGWVLAGLVVVVMLVFSPLRFWAGLTGLLLVVEAIRCAVHGARRAQQGTVA